jgi:ATP-dependent RNA helicase MSS116
MIAAPSILTSKLLTARGITSPALHLHRYALPSVSQFRFQARSIMTAQNHGGRGGHNFRRRKPNPNGNGNGNGPSQGHRQQSTAAAPAPAIEMPALAPEAAEAVAAADAPKFSSLAGQNVLHPTLLATIVEDLKFDSMLPVQVASVKSLMPPARPDALVQAKTGTGKTVAFLLPALQTMLTLNRPKRNRGISLLVISPTRELAMQIEAEARRMLQRFPEYRVCHAIGGTNKNAETNNFKRGCDILVATPGRMIDHMGEDGMAHLLQNLDTLVLDEADRLLDMGFKRDLARIIEGLPDKKASNRQGLLFSATIPAHVQEVAGLALSPGYQHISTIPEGEANTHARVPQILVKAPSFALTLPTAISAIRDEAKVVAASEGSPAFKAIVFAPTAALADFYAHVLSHLSDMPPVSVLHSRISQSKRTKVTNDYRVARTAIIVTTDVIARGMDFPGVTSVFQVGLPMDKESYIHRLGRTARAGAAGRGIFVVSEAEAWFPTYSLREFKLQQQEPNLSCAGEVSAIAARMGEEMQAKIYQAWLGYYKNFCKQFKWSNEALVAQGNIFASEGLQAPETPAIEKKTIGKMGLKGVKGLRIGPPRDRPMPTPRGGGGGGFQRGVKRGHAE